MEHGLMKDSICLIEISLLRDLICWNRSWIDDNVGEEMSLSRTGQWGVEVTDVVSNRSCSQGIQLCRTLQVLSDHQCVVSCIVPSQHIWWILALVYTFCSCETFAVSWLVACMPITYRDVDDMWCSWLLMQRLLASSSQSRWHLFSLLRWTDSQRKFLLSFVALLINLLILDE